MWRHQRRNNCTKIGNSVGFLGLIEGRRGKQMMLALVLAVVVKVEAVSSPAILSENLKEISLQTLIENVLCFSVSFLLKVENFSRN